MSQQSLTFLSQAANNLHKPPRPHGGQDQFRAGNAGTALSLKTDTAEHVAGLRKKVEDAEVGSIMSFLIFTSREEGFSYLRKRRHQTKEPGKWQGVS